MCRQIFLPTEGLYWEAGMDDDADTAESADERGSELRGSVLRGSVLRGSRG